MVVLSQLCLLKEGRRGVLLIGLGGPNLPR